MKFNLLLKKKSRREWMLLEVMSYSEIRPLTVNIHNALQVEGVIVSTRVLNDEIERELEPESIRNKAAEQWIQRLIIQNFGSSCEYWPYKIDRRGAVIRLMGRDHTLNRLSVQVLGDQAAKGKFFTQHICGNIDCINPLHLKVTDKPRQKIYDPDLILAYMAANPEYTQREVAKQIGCAPSTITRLVLGETFKSKK